MDGLPQRKRLLGRRRGLASYINKDLGNIRGKIVERIKSTVDEIFLRQANYQDGSQPCVYVKRPALKTEKSGATKQW